MEFDFSRSRTLNSPHQAIPGTALSMGFLLRSAFVAIWILSLGGSANLLAQSDKVAKIDEVSIGVEESSKVGCWTRVLVIVAGRKNDSLTVEIDAADSDGSTVTYTNGSLQAVRRDNKLVFERYVKLGRLEGEVTVRLMSDEQVVDSKSVPLRGVGFSTQPWLVSVFGEIGLKRWVRRRKFEEANRPVISSITKAADLPLDSRGWDGVGQVAISTGDGVWEEVTDQQWQALDDWVRCGGELILMVGQAGKAVSQHDLVSSWLPGQYSVTEQIRENPSIEDFASAEAVLPPIQITQLTEIDGRVEARYGRRGRTSGPVIIRRAYGFGVILFCGIDLDQDPVATWEARERFLEQMLDLSQAEWMTEQSSTGVKYGHTEMSGQLRATLDSYEPSDESGRGVRVLAFSVIVGFLVFYLLIIGPVDFFFLRRFVKRMEWTWVTFPLVLLGTCGLILGLHSWRLGGKPTRLNQVDIVDLDMVDGTMRGRAWASLFTARSGAFNLSAAPDMSLFEGDVRRQSLLWQGHPGKGLGGFQAVSNVRWADSHYGIATDDESFRIAQMPMAAASSRSLIAQWEGRLPADSYAKLKAKLIMNSSNKLNGTVVNPLDTVLLRPVLVYQNTIYRLGKQLGARKRVDVGEPDRTLEWELTRRKTYDATRPSSDTVTPWDPLEKDVRRLVEVMLHHKAAGGAAYTQLEQRYQGEIDLSQHLELGRAILWGEVEEPAVRLNVNDEDATADAERHWTFYRVILPVETD
jgi:hypothetical protein